jgi:hypothetical protein
VLKALDDGGTLRQDVDRVPYVEMFGGRIVEEVFSIARDNPQVDEARRAIQNLQHTALTDEMRKLYRRLGGDEPNFVLIESEWHVSDENGELWLQLSTLRPRAETGYVDEEGHGPDPAEAVDMPEKLSLVVRLPKSDLTERGKDRLVTGADRKVSVLGTTGYFEEGIAKGSEYETDRLWVTPIAAFARIYG